LDYLAFCTRDTAVRDGVTYLPLPVVVQQRFSWFILYTRKKALASLPLPPCKKNILDTVTGLVMMKTRRRWRALVTVASLLRVLQTVFSVLRAFV
jgi:hypothetical protein